MDARSNVSVLYLSDEDEEEEGETKVAVESDAGDGPALVSNHIPDEDLELLLEKVEQLTTLTGLTPSDWNNEVYTVVTYFLEHPQELVLTIYFNESQLAASLGFPSTPVLDLTYFMKGPTEITPENFCEVVKFGTLGSNVESTVLNLMESLFAPLIYCETQWPDTVKGELCSSLNVFLSYLTDLTYNMLGTTVLYVPCEAIMLSVEQACNRKELVKRLEGLVVQWTRQIRVALGDVEQASSQEDKYVRDEFDFWVYRYKNLSGLKFQLQNEQLKHISSILQMAQSTYIQQFFDLIRDIQASLDEAKSNIEFLQILNEPCAEVEKVTNPAEIPGYLPKIIHLLRTIWMNSPYYNTNEKLCGLFKALSNQIITQCKNSVMLLPILDGNSSLGSEQLEACICCLEKYRALYDTIAEAHREYTNEEWLLDDKMIFSHLESFNQRCRDLLEVCQCMIIFGRMNEKEKIPKPQFGGAHGPEFEGICDKVESLFRDYLGAIKSVHKCILLVQDASWHDHILKFRNQMKELEVIIENMVTSAFEKVTTVEEGIEMLQAIYHYSKRESLRPLFDRKTAHVYKLVSEEIQDTKQYMISERREFPSCTPYYSGRAMIANMRKSRLVRLMEQLDNAQWMPYCGVGEEVRIQYKKLVKSIDDTINKLYIKWVDSVTSMDAEVLLNRPLMCRSVSHPGLLECNLDRNLVSLYREVKYWRVMAYSIPRNVMKMYKKLQSSRFVYESVLSVVMDYNYLITSLSPDERVLFKELIKVCNKKINPGLNKLQWTADVSNLYINDCLSYTTELQACINDFKNCCLQIVCLCERICDVPLIYVDVSEPYELRQLKEFLLDYRRKALSRITNMYEDIIKLLAIIYEGFEEYLDRMGHHWAIYINRMDAMLEEALQLGVRNSLSIMLKVMRGSDLTSDPCPIIKIRAYLQDTKISFDPTMSEVGHMINDIFPVLASSLQDITRIHEVFAVPSNSRYPYTTAVLTDDECRKLRSLLNGEVAFTIEQMQNYFKIWEPFRDIWEINKDMFISRYEKLNPSAFTFDNDIGRYTEVASQVQIQDSLSLVQIFAINSTDLKVKIVEHCVEWQSELTTLLYKVTERMVKRLHAYIKTNSEKSKHEPKNLQELQESMQLMERLRQDIPKKESEFTPIHEHYGVLVKYDVAVSDEMLGLINTMEPLWKEYVLSLDDCQEMVDKNKDRFRTALLETADIFKKEASNLCEKFLAEGPFSSTWKTKVALRKLRKLRKEMDRLNAKQEQLKSDLGIFGISLPINHDLIELDKELTSLEAVWDLTNRWEQDWRKYKHSAFSDIETDEMGEEAQTLFRQLTRLTRELQEKNWSIVEHSRSRVDAFRRTLPLITSLKNPALRKRHWDQVRSLVGGKFNETSKRFTLETIMRMNFQKYYEEINEISNAASMELQIEMGLKGISDTWKIMELEMAEYKDAYKLTTVDDIFQAIEDNQASLSSMKSTKFVEPFAQEVDYWEHALNIIMEVLDMVLLVQRQWLYLENIFAGEDIRKQLPKESEDFDDVSHTWTKITNIMHKNKNALKATHYPGVSKSLNGLNEKLEGIQRALETYLETKRHIFPRFYFISNDDLLEILAQGKKPELVQPHLKKCFDNINKVKLQKSVIPNILEAAGMISGDGEYVEFVTPVILEGPVELWLCDIERTMRKTLLEELRQCRLSLRKNLLQRDKWIKEWPGQMCITSSQMQWTTDCTRALAYCKLSESRSPLRKLRKKQNRVLGRFSDAIRGSLTKLQRLKVVALVTIEIHARDVIDKMYKTNCMDVTAFEWLSQLRFYWDHDIDDCIIRQTNTYFVYGYEYLGNSGRLVITPLTDRCYITLTTALHLHRGGSPKGPAGTGKTETVKDLGKSLGSYVIVINCSEGLDYKSMGRMFSGFAQTGAWGCFDEFNRINIEVLSVVAQQILSILSALTNKLKRFVFEGNEINLVLSCGLFITMNPGYAGRTELPDNLKSMFRPISMIVPDSNMIAEIILFGEGFRDTRALAKKVYSLYCLARQQLSKQDHYDFGLRGLVSLLRYGGRKRRENPNLPDDEVVLLAMKDMNEAKLTRDDFPLFNGIISDLFPNVVAPVIDYEELTVTIEKCLKTSFYQCTTSSIIKIIQLYETKNSRHSVMIVGRTGSGKSVTWRMLQKTMITLCESGHPDFNIVRDYPINPKALNLGELYGEFDLSTNEWKDGVLSSIMRNTCSEETPDQKWIVFDGPVDAVWIENMNSVMDDNKVLTLINSERITMPDQVSLLFEVEDLSEASPATVSRCGMVYNDFKDLGWEPYVTSWLQKHNEEYSNEMEKHFDSIIASLLRFKHVQCKEPVAVSEINLLASLCRLLDCVSTKQNGLDPGDKSHFAQMSKLWFLFCVIWSICATVDEDGRKKLDSYIRGHETVFPLKDTIYEYYVDVKINAFAAWEDALPTDWKIAKGIPFYRIIVPTVDTLRYQFLILEMLKNKFPCLLMGPVGTGKTLTAFSSLESLDEVHYALLTINMSAQTTSNNVQDIIESKLEKRAKGIYVPPASKTMITFMDDFNMPAKEVYGAQPPLELVRQWLDYGFWYDRAKQWTKHIKNMIIMAAMGPPGGGRNFISNRLMSCFNILNVTFPSNPQIIRIFGSMLSQHLADFDEEPKYVGPKVTSSTIDLYNKVIIKMLPTPTKMHYMFNLRDISKVFQGLMRGDREKLFTRDKLLRLWVHECFRVFYDRLIDDKDQEWFLEQINEQLGVNFEQTFNGVCPEKECPVFGDFINPYNIYEDLTDWNILQGFLLKQLEEYNMSPGVIAMDLVLFKDAILHVCRVIRVVSQPRGNMLLVGIGGSGRQSLSKLASYICEYVVFQIEVTKNYRVMEFREDLKTLYRKTGVEKKATIFLFSDTQVIVESFLEIVNNMLSSGEVPNLYKPEEFDEIKSALSTDASKEGILPSVEAMFKYLIDRVRAKLHIVLCMSPIGEAFRNRLRQYPSLVNCTTIDWFMEWPSEALLEVANKYLSDVDFLSTIAEDVEYSKDYDAQAAQLLLKNGVASTFATMHDSVSKCSKVMLIELKRHNYVTPTNYLELVAGYKIMLNEKRASVKANADKLRNGLFKIDDTKAKVEVMSVELQEATVKVGEFQQECDEYLKMIMAQRSDADEQQTAVAESKVKILQEEKVCKRLAAVAQADLDEAMPALEEAMRALDALNKRDLTEVKSYGRPPAKVEMVMEAVMILKQVEPTWAEAKRQLGEPNFINQLREFDKDNISDRTLKKIGTYTTNADFEPDKVGIVSFAAKSLCMWVIAIEKYGKIYRVVAPKKAKLDEAMSTLQAKQQALASAEAKLKELSDYLALLQKQYEEKLSQKEELRLKAEMLAQKLERAEALVKGLSGERARWTETVKTLVALYAVLPGDCLISTGFVSYMGPFLSQYREKLLKNWRKCIKSLEIPNSENYDIASFLSDPTTIREWNIQGLPSDGFSTENGIIVTRGTRWPLLIDPQCQGMEWLKSMERANGLEVIDFGQTDFMKTLEKSIQNGTPVLLQNVMETLDPSLSPILNKAVVKQSGELLMKLSEKMVHYNPDFRFFITTKLGNPHYPPEITTKTTLVNFAVKQQGLEAQLLGIVVRKEKPQLEEQKDTLVLNIAAGRRTLMDLEDELLRLLYETKGSLLDDLQLLITLQTSQTTAAAISEQLAVAEVTEVEIDTAREGYRPCAKRASILFFVLTDTSQIDPMYQFSLDAYISLFIISIDKSKKSHVLEERIHHLNEFHTYSVYRNTCRGLFERHKLLFSFHMCIKILDAMGMVSRNEYNFLLKGGVVLDREEQMDNPCPEWLSDTAWDNITELDKLPGFHGSVDTFEQNPRPWHAWYTSKQPEDLPLIGEWEDACSQFQKMLFVRCLRPDRISFCVTSFIVSTLGQKFVEPPVLDVRSVLEDSTSRTPLIFVLSPGVDPTNSLIQLAQVMDMTEKFMSLSLGQGQAPIATRMIKIGAKEGNWVFLANCHLSLSWMPALDKIVETLQTTKVHTDFRLWLSSSPNPEFPISILQAGIKMTTEPPKGLKANLQRLYQTMTEERFNVCQNKSKYSRLLFCLCYFHAILLERKKFQQLGWNVVYSFNDSDFEVSENLLSIYLDEYSETPWDALKYLIAGVNYGGHVTDDWDRRLLLTYINMYFNEDVLTTNCYRLSSLPTYHIPRDGSLETYLDYIAVLPNVDRPEAFGQHSNADITSLISETLELFSTLMLMEVQASSSQAESKEDKVMQLSSDVLLKLPKPMNYENTEKLIGTAKKPLDVVLLQEILRYNSLLQSISVSLQELQKGIQGLVVMSSELEDIFNCIYEGRVPHGWLKAYPSLKPLGSWTRDLFLRIEHFSQWATTIRPPVTFWLSAFTFPTGLLTAVLQTAARKNGISVDTLSWEFLVFDVEPNTTLFPPEDGMFVRGMFLEGAGWNYKTMTLCEPEAMQLVYTMPLIHFNPVEQLHKKMRGLYVSPCYYFPQRCGAAGREAYVVSVDLKTGESAPDHWTKRGAALLLSLST